MVKIICPTLDCLKTHEGDRFHRMDMQKAAVVDGQICYAVFGELDPEDNFFETSHASLELS